MRAPSPMKRGFYTIMAAQFFSALADNALLVAAMKMLEEQAAAPWLTPHLKLFFTVSYVVLAPFVGAFADSQPKGRVMFISNGIKIVGCLAMYFGVSPIAAYAVVGFGAAAYSPAKCGILTELLPAEQLVVANGWIEGLTVAAIILGVVTGGMLIGEDAILFLQSIDLPGFDTGITSGAQLAIGALAFVYIVAAIINLFVPLTGVEMRPFLRHPGTMLKEFGHCFLALWRDPYGRISLTVTTLFWGAGATLQFIVIRWLEIAMGIPLAKASKLQAVVAVGVALGAVVAARRLSLKDAVKVVPVGIFMGLFVILMIPVKSVAVALVLMVIVGGLGGFFVVPMNALLQHRGHVLMNAGQSISVQNFNENLSIIAMTAGYSALLYAELSIYVIIAIFGSFVAGTMLAVQQMLKHERKVHGEIPLH